MNFQPLRDFLDFYLPMLGIPGSDTRIYRNHEEIFNYQSGYDNVRFRTPVRDNSLYHLYSISKISCAVAAVQLIERGEIMVGDPVYAYFPEYKNITVCRKNADGTEEITPAKNPLLIKHLLTMTGGFDYNLSRPSIARVVAETDGRAPTLDVVRALAADPLCFDPGEHYSYSLCLDVMGGIIELVSGVKLSEYMNENIFSPLGMTHTMFGMNDDIKSRLATQYDYDYKNKCPIEIPIDQNPFVFGTEYESAGAGIISSAEDQIILADALAMGGVGANGNRILSRFGVDLMRTNCLNDTQLADYRSGLSFDSCGYGYGYGVRTNMNPVEFGNLAPKGEFGWSGAKQSYTCISPELGVSMFHAEHMGGLHDVVLPRLRNLVFSCLGE